MCILEEAFVTSKNWPSTILNLILLPNYGVWLSVEDTVTSLYTVH